MPGSTRLADLATRVFGCLGRGGRLGCSHIGPVAGGSRSTLGYSMATSIVVPDGSVHLIKVFVETSGSGLVSVPHAPGMFDVLNVPGPVLGLIVTLKTHGRGFTIRAGGPATATGPFVGLDA